jgi:hypothetical protein
LVGTGFEGIGHYDLKLVAFHNLLMISSALTDVSSCSIDMWPRYGVPELDVNHAMVSVGAHIFCDKTDRMGRESDLDELIL